MLKVAPFSITNGLSDNGGGICGNGTQAKIIFCHIKGNTANAAGNLSLKLLQPKYNYKVK
jgi:hypothetical protein